MNPKIDFVITWVDGSDPEWIEVKNRYISQNFQKRQDIAGKDRFTDNGLLHYWFRGVEKFAPWVNKVYFVTFGHIPQWLDVDNPKLVIVKHQDFLPPKYLPTFNSNTLTLNLHRIPGLSEHFVYFNDDMFLTSNCSEDVFFKNNLPRDMAVQDVIPAVEMTEFWHMYFNNITCLNKNFNKKQLIKIHFNKWFSLEYGKQIIKNVLLSPFSLFTGIFETHTPNSYLKSSYVKEWEKNHDLFDSVSQHKIRNYQDVTEWYIRYAQMVQGKFEPINKLKIGRYCSMKSKNLDQLILSQKYKYICINDEVEGEAFEKVRSAFDKILSNKSSFEK